MFINLPATVDSVRDTINHYRALTYRGLRR